MVLHCGSEVNGLDFGVQRLKNMLIRGNSTYVNIIVVDLVRYVVADKLTMN